MFSFTKSKSADSNQDESQPPQDKRGLFSRLIQGLTRTRSGLTSGLADLTLGKKSIDDELLEDIETLLLTADIGVEATQRIITDLTNRVSRKELKDSESLLSALKDDMTAILAPCDAPIEIDTRHKPFNPDGRRQWRR